MLTKKSTKSTNGDGFLRLKEILELIPVSRSSWWNGVKEGRYPKSVKIGLRTTAWTRSSIDTLINQLSDGEAK